MKQVILDCFSSPLVRSLLLSPSVRPLLVSLKADNWLLRLHKKQKQQSPFLLGKDSAQAQTQPSSEDQNWPVRRKDSKGACMDCTVLYGTSSLECKTLLRFKIVQFLCHKSQEFLRIMMHSPHFFLLFVIRVVQMLSAHLDAVSSRMAG